MRIAKVLPIASVFAALLAMPANADDVSDAIAKAQTAYNEGKVGEAKTNLDMAIALLAQKNAERLKALLPAAPDGWTATDGETSAIPMGGITVSRRYSKDDKTVEIQLVTDSPMMAMMMSLFTNPQMAIMSGAKIQNVGAQQVMITQQGDVQALVANKYLLTFNGSAPSEDKLTFAGLIDYAALTAFQ